MSFWVAGHLAGGLGNRLFQHASAMGLAEKWGHRCVFYLPAADPTNHGPFESLFKLFPQTPILVQEEPALIIPEPNGHVFTYSPFNPDRIGANVVIDGYRQTDKYFPALGVKASLEDAVPLSRRQELLQKYGLETQSQKESTCFLHIRLGDYKTLPHHQMNLGSYLQNAAKEFPNGTRFLVFSDEALEFQTTLEDFVKVVGHEPLVVTEKDELENLYLMSQCWKGAIVANSTFSWWGAYFARQRCSNPKDFKACYPTMWGSGLPLARDVIPSWGTKIASS